MVTGSLSVGVTSEVAPLRQVVVHRPGDEIVRMTQHDLGDLLFDDILSPPETVREHDMLVDILRGSGARVVDVRDLLQRALDRAPIDDRRQLLERCCRPHGVVELVDVLLAWPAERLSLALVAGLAWRDVAREAVQSLGRLRAESRTPDAIALPPLPNLMFTRDPCIAIHDRIVVGRMAHDARHREPLLVAFGLRHSQAVTDPKFCFEDQGRGDDRGPSSRGLEGGDVLVVSEKTLLIGCSERTRAPTIERLAREALFPALPELLRVFVVMMPERRTMMHLDTMLTQVDTELFLGFRPLLEAGHAHETPVPVARLERDRPACLLQGATVMDVLREELGGDVRLVPCGGEDHLHQQREQWTDGANAICVGPGHIILYARNVHTIGALRRHGFEEVRLHVAQSPAERADRVAEGLRRERSVFSFSGSELSRARGGGRCLTMPLRRAHRDDDDDGDATKSS
ncbi:MAG: arginine deiminase family protein [Myxococcota bacterium]